MASGEASTSKNYDLLTSIVISVNCNLVGSIFVAPWAYIQSGWLLSTVLTILGFLIMTNLALTFLQVLSRMKILHNYSKEGHTISHIPLLDLLKNRPSSHYISKSLISEENSNLLQNPSEINKPPQLKFDFAMICKTLLGQNVEKIMIIIYVLNYLTFLMAAPLPLLLPLQT